MKCLPISCPPPPINRTAPIIDKSDGDRQPAARRALNVSSLNDEEVLVPRTKVFGCRALPQDGPVEIGVRGNWLAVRIGPFCAFQHIVRDGAFPDVTRRVPYADSAAARFQVTPEDAEFVLENLPRLPGREDYHLPVTVDLNGQVAIRAKADGQTVPTELVPTAATLSGDPVRLNMNRRYLAGAPALDFRGVRAFSPKGRRSARTASASTSGPC